MHCCFLVYWFAAVTLVLFFADSEGVDTVRVLQEFVSKKQGSEIKQRKLKQVR